jgi:hypothetical protein
MSRITSACSSPYLFHMVETLAAALFAHNRILIPEIVTITAEAEPPIPVDPDFTALTQPMVQSEPENESDHINLLKFLPRDHFLPHSRRMTVPVEAGSADGLMFSSCFVRRLSCSPSSRWVSLHGEMITSAPADCITDKLTIQPLSLHVSLSGDRPRALVQLASATSSRGSLHQTMLFLTD